MKSSKKNLVVLDIEGIVYGFCDPEIASKENKNDFEERYFCFGNLSERSTFNFTETHVCNLFCRALAIQPPNAK